MRLVADGVVEWGIVAAIASATVWRVLKKHALTPWVKEPWGIPAANAECVARLADLRDRYDAPADPTRPRVCVAERPCQVLAESREPQPLAPGPPRRCDSAYTRPDTWNLGMLAEPFQGGRQLTVTPRRTQQALAHCLAELGAVHGPTAEQMRVVWDHRSPYPPAALSAVFPPADARRLRRTLEFQRTPGQGRWGNRAAMERAVLARQCLNRRMLAVQTRGRAVAAWEA